MMISINVTQGYWSLEIAINFCERRRGPKYFVTLTVQTAGREASGTRTLAARGRNGFHGTHPQGEMVDAVQQMRKNGVI